MFFIAVKFYHKKRITGALMCVEDPPLFVRDLFHSPFHKWSFFLHELLLSVYKPSWQIIVLSSDIYSLNSLATIMKILYNLDDK